MSEKTEEATDKKLQDARKKGEVAKSKDLVGAAVFCSVLGLLWVAHESFLVRLTNILDLAVNAQTHLMQGRSWRWLLEQAVNEAAHVVLPVVGISAMAAIAANVAQVRGVFSLDPLIPKLSNLNPAQGVAKLFSSRQLFEMLKMLLKVSLLSAVCVLVVRGALAPAFGSVYAQPLVAGQIGWRLLIWLFGAAAAVYVGMAFIDLGIQIFEFLKGKRMTKEEVKQERRNSDGDPMIRSKMRQLRREFASNAGQPLAKATVVITNPTHFAVALWYEQGTTDLPVVIQKGVEADALAIRRQAALSKIPTVENRPLARRLYAEVACDETISEAHFEAVAEVLRWVRSMAKETATQP